MQQANYFATEIIGAYFFFCSNDSASRLFFLLFSNASLFLTASFIAGKFAQHHSSRVKLQWACIFLGTGATSDCVWGAFIQVAMPVNRGRSISTAPRLGIRACPLLDVGGAANEAPNRLH